MRKMTLAIMAILMCFISANAGIKVKGDISAMKGQKINVVIDYSNAKIDGDKPELWINEYLENKTEEEKATFHKSWNDSAKINCKNKFIKDFNEELSQKSEAVVGDFSTAAYSIVIKITDMRVLDYRGPFAGNTRLFGEVSFIENATNKELGKSDFNNVMGTLPIFTPLARLADAFSILGEEYGETCGKKLKK